MNVVSHARFLLTRRCTIELLVLPHQLNTPIRDTPNVLGNKTKQANVKKFGKPDELRRFENGKVQLINLNGATIGRAVLEPGWKWSKHVKSIAKTKSCEAPHFQYHATGVLHVKMDDGTEMEVGPGEVSYLPPGHDAWVVGAEPVTLIDFQGIADYAKESSK